MIEVDNDISEIQIFLKKIISAQLDIGETDLDFDQPLLELGADSIVMATTLTNIQEKYGVSLQMLQLFEEIPDISSIASYISKHVIVK